MNFVKRTYEKNIQLIKSAIPQVYNRLLNVNETTCKVIISKNGNKNISKFINGTYINIHSGENPIFQARFVANEILKEQRDIIFIFGFGMGHEISEFLKKDEKRIYFIVEPDIEVFSKAIRYVDMNYLVSKNVTMVISDNVYEIMESFKYLINEKRTLSCKVYILPSYNSIYKKLLDELNHNIRKFLKDIRTDLHTTSALQRKWMYNSICNLKFLNKMAPIKTLESVFENVPIIIVGAGPSLNYDLESLKKVGDNAIIVAVGTAVKILLRNNIRFHIAAAIDADKQAFTIENQYEDKIKKYILFYSTQVDPSVLERFLGPKFMINQFLMDNFILDEVHYDYYERYSGPSISNAIIYNLANLRCKKIFLLGQDMCYVNKNLYAEGAGEDNKFFEERGGYIKTYNKNGDEVYTETQFLAIKHSMERCIKEYPNVKFYNCTRDGLNIEGAENIDFNVFLLENLNIKYNVLDKIYDLYNKFIKEVDENKIDTLILSIKNSNEEVIKICREIIVLIQENSGNDVIHKKNNELLNNKFFAYILKDMIKYCDFIYSEKGVKEKKEQTYAYILEKCLLMRTAFEDELKIRAD